MKPDDKVLPKYRRPPVVEVAIVVYFNPLGALKTAHYGCFWKINERDYPKTEDHAPILEAIPAEFQLPPLRRVFLISVDDIYIMQFQPNLFGHNWRKTKDTDEYPSFDHAKGLFLEKWRLFQDFLESTKLGHPELTRYEVTYVNHLVERPGAFPAAIADYSPLISLRPDLPQHFLPGPKSLLADVQFDIPENRGTLRVSFKQGKRLRDQAEVMQLDLTARCPAKADGSDMESWLETAHEWIVRGFTDLTIESAHKKWERFQ